MKTFLFYVASFFTYLAMIKGLIYLITGFLFMDACLAWYIIYVDENVDFEFKKLWHLFKKWAFYISTIILCSLFDNFVLENELFGINLFLSKFICTCWVFHESKSINEKWIFLGNRSIFGSVKEFVEDLKCIRNQYNDFKK